MADLGPWALFVIIPVVAMWVGALIDIVRRADLSRTAVVVWILVILVLPILGVVIYVIARPRVVTRRGKLPSPEELERDLVNSRQPSRYDRYTR